MNYQTVVSILTAMGFGDKPLRGLMGSTFNPSHEGHALATELVLNSGFFHTVEVAAAGRTPGTKEDITDDLVRQQLALLAFPMEWIYTAPPVRSGTLLRRAFLELDLSPIMGIDKPTAIRFYEAQERYPMFQHIAITASDAVTPDPVTGVMPIFKWRYQELLRTIPLWIIPRTGFSSPLEINLPSEFPRMAWFPGTYPPLPDIRSSTIRQLVATSQPWEHLVPERVAKFIKLKQLYGYKE